MDRSVLRLPPELIACTIGFLADDKPSLASCSLTCKDWLHPARCHLFERLDLFLRTDEDYIILEGEDVDKDMLLLLDMASDPPTTLSTYTKYLYIETSYAFTMWTCDVEAPVLACVVENLPQLRLLSLADVSVHAHGWTPEASALSLRRLELAFITEMHETHDRIDVIADTLSLFSTIEHLDIQILRTDSFKGTPRGSEPPKSHIANHLRVKSLDLTHCGVSPTAEDLLDILRPSLIHTLTSLQLLALKSSFIPTVGLLIKDVSSQLLKFTFNVGWLVTDYFDTHEGPADDCLSKERWTLFHLAECDALETITLIISPNDYRKHPTVLGKAIINGLHLIPTNVRHINFRFGGQSSELRNSKITSKTELFMDPTALDGILSQRLNLSTITFQFPLVSSHHNLNLLTKWLEYVRGELPGCHARGLLRAEACAESPYP